MGKNRCFAFTGGRPVQSGKRCQDVRKSRAWPNWHNRSAPLSSSLIPAELRQLEPPSSRPGLGSSNLLILVGGALIHRVYVILRYFKQRLWCVLDMREIDYRYGILFIKSVFVQDCPRSNAVLLKVFTYCWKTLFLEWKGKCGDQLLNTLVGLELVYTKFLVVHQQLRQHACCTVLVRSPFSMQFLLSVVTE